MDGGRSFGEAREPSRFAAFDGLIETCRRTRAALVAVAHERSGDGDLVRAVIADDGLAHVDAVRAGLTALARAGQFDSAELRDLVRREGITDRPRTGPDVVAAAAEASHNRPPLRPADTGQILAAGHARIVFSVIPTLPPEAVTWPRVHRTYADIPTPVPRPSCSSGSTSSRGCFGGSPRAGTIATSRCVARSPSTRRGRGCPCAAGSAPPDARGAAFEIRRRLGGSGVGDGLTPPDRRA